jgi:HEAT repeat protein
MFGIRLLRCALWSLSLLAIAGVARAAAPDDPVLDLRVALRAPVRSPNNPDELEFRQRNLARKVDALTNIADLGQALLLQEWHIEDQDERVARINQSMRTLVVQKFDASARAILRNGSPRAKEAVARLIGELGVDVRGIGSNWGGAMRPLAPPVAALLVKGDEAGRAAAAEALGRINAEADIAVPALSRALTDDRTPVRRAAAAAFAAWIKKATQLSKNQSAGGVLVYRRDVFDSATGTFMAVGSDPLTGLTLLAGLTNVVGEGPGVTEVVVTRDELQTLAAAVVPIAARGVRDADAQVRRNSLDALHQVAVSLVDMVADPRARTEFPQEGRRPSRDEDRFITQYRYEVDAERQELLPLAQALRKEANAFRRALTDPDQAVRLEACETMIEIGLVRVKLQRRLSSVPPFDNAKLPADQDPILALYKEVLPQLEEAATDPVLQVRLHAIEATEMLGPDVILAVSTLEGALTDRDRFVRWAAIRALGRLTPEQGEKVVPLLIPLLRDTDIDLRMMATSTLDHYGAKARLALPELRRAVLVGDADMRRAAISAILAMGTEVAKDAIPTFIEAVDDEQSPVRRAAAEALAPFGSAAKDAIPALTKLQESDELDDRKAATYAILKILTSK